MGVQTNKSTLLYIPISQTTTKLLHEKAFDNSIVVYVKYGSTYVYVMTWCDNNDQSDQFVFIIRTLFFIFCPDAWPGVQELRSIAYSDQYSC
jgi:hypothetical protein